MTDCKEKIIEAKNICKSFGYVKALDGVDFELYANEVLGLLGDNAAGKSTLIKILSGAIVPDKGEIYFCGKNVRFNSPLEARKLGIETIYQDLALFNNLDVVANVFSGRELYLSSWFGKLFRLINRRKMYLESKNSIDKLLVNIPNLYDEVEMFSGGQRQSIAIAKAVYWGSKIIIMDEPTAALGVKETQRVLQLVESLKNHKISVILIMHNIEQVMRVADRAIILRTGKRVGNIEIKKNDKECRDQIISLMM